MFKIYKIKEKDLIDTMRLDRVNENKRICVLFFTLVSQSFRISNHLESPVNEVVKGRQFFLLQDILHLSKKIFTSHLVSQRYRLIQTLQDI